MTGVQTCALPIYKANKEYIDLVLKDNLVVAEGLNEKNKYSFNINVDDIKLPIKKNDKVGTIEVLLKNKVISKEDLVSNSNVNKLNVLDLYKKNILNIISGNM